MEANVGIEVKEEKEINEETKAQNIKDMQEIKNDMQEIKDDIDMQETKNIEQREDVQEKSNA